MASKPVVLHLGDPVKFNTSLYEQLSQQFAIIRPSDAERQREPFLQALRNKKWGNFSAVLRPWWATGGEMGRWDKELISLLPSSMKVYASAGAGFDWADVDLMAEAGILYCNGATASSEAVADMALYHILSVFRNMQWSNMAARSQDPVQFRDAHINAPFTAHNPRGHTLGVIGLGNIGYTTATKAHAAFGMKIIYTDPVPRSVQQETAISARRCEIYDLLAEADCVVLAAPGAGGKKILDAEKIRKMKRGARLVNIARGSLVDQEAVADALEEGILSAVGLDVHEHEPEVSGRLAKNRNATLTCHTAGGALETAIGFEELAIKNVLAVLTGKDPLTPVNKHLFKSS